MPNIFEEHNNTHDELKKVSPVGNDPMYGLYKAEATGEFLEDDNQYIRVKVNGVGYYARPCYAFGGRVSAPSKEFLKKYKTQIYLYVVFEEANPSKCIWLGWNWLDGKQTGIDDFPDAAYYRTRFFKEEINDKTKEWNLSFDDGTVQYKQQFTKDRWYIKWKEVLFEITNKIKFKSKQHVISADQIKIGSDNPHEAMVLGNTLNQNLSSFIKVVNLIIIQCQLIATNAATGVTSINPGSAAALSANVIALQALSGQLNAVSALLQQQLSKKTKVE